MALCCRYLQRPAWGHPDKWAGNEDKEEEDWKTAHKSEAHILQSGQPTTGRMAGGSLVAGLCMDGRAEWEQNAKAGGKIA
jgi:hypothetical protein